MLTDKDIEKFYLDFESMGLTKPNATMRNATGLSSGNVSDYLNRKKKPSESFINAFYSKVFKSSINAPHGTYTEQRRNLKNNSTKSNDVPMYSGYNTLGNIEVIDDENVKHRVMAHLPAEVFPGCDYA